MGFTKSLSIIIVSLLLTLSQPVAAKSMNIKQAVEVAKRQYGGKVLGAKDYQKGKQRYFKIKMLLDNGRVKTLYINANNGRLSERKPG